MNTTMSEGKNKLKINSRLGITEKKIGDLIDTAIKTVQTETEEKVMMKDKVRKNQ